MSALISWLRQLKSNKSAAQGGASAERKALVRMLRESCPRCQLKLAGHHYQLFTITVAGEDRRVELESFFKLAKAHKWKELESFRGFDPTKDAVNLYSLRCLDSKITAIYMRNPYELYESPAMIDWDPLEEKETQNWTQHLPDEKWNAFV
jgi:hypothetical protein